MNHTGLVVKVTKDRVYIIEGNTSSASGVVPNGGAVRDKSYSINYAKIGGYGRPKYELIEEDEDMTQETFNTMMDNYIKNLADQPMTWDASAIQWAVNNGLMKGDDQGRMMAKKFVTRGELATMLQRFADIKP